MRFCIKVAQCNIDTKATRVTQPPFILQHPQLIVPFSTSLHKVDFENQQ